MAARLSCTAAFLLACSFASPVRGQSDGDLARLVEDLGAEDYRTREEATESLWRAGRAAVPFLEAVAGSSDLEVRGRAQRLLPLVRWDASRLLLETCHRILAYDSAGPDERSSILLAVLDAGPAAGRSFVEAVLEQEGVGSVWQVALEVWCDWFGDPLAWLESRVDEGRAGARAVGYLGNRYREMDPESLPRERVGRLAEALLERNVPIVDPETYLDWTSAALAVGRDDLADRLIERAFSIEGCAPGTWVGAVERLLDRSRVADAEALAVELAGSNGADPTCAAGLVGAFLARGWSAEAGRVAAAAGATGDDPDLRRALVEVFVLHIDLDRAAAIASEPDVGRIARLRLDEQTVVGALEAKRGVGQVRALAEALLWFGRGADALAAIGEGADASGDAGLALRAAVAAGDEEAISTRIEGALEEWRAGRTPFEGEREVLRALVEGLLDVGPDAVALAAASDALLGLEGELDRLIAAYAASGDAGSLRSIGDEPGYPSRLFDLEFATGQIAEREDRPDEALHHYARALAASWASADGALAWHSEEVRRKAAYLGADERIRTAARARAARDLSSLAVLAECAGQPGLAARLHERVSLRRGEPDEARRLHALDAARLFLAAGQPESAAAALERLRRGGPDDPWALAAARLAGEAVDRDPGPTVRARSATYFTTRGLDSLALAEWEAVLASHRAEEGRDLARASAREYRAKILERRGGADAEVARELLAALQSAWVHGFEFVELGGEPALRARRELALARSAPDPAGAADRATRALAFEPRSIEAALLLAERAEDLDPGRSARARARAARELGRRALLEPRNGALDARRAPGRGGLGK